MITRREWLQRVLAAGAMSALDLRSVAAGEAGATGLIARAIPSSGERLPIVGLGSSATFAQVARTEDASALRAVLQRMVELGGRVFDTAPQYAASHPAVTAITPATSQPANMADNMGAATGALPDDAMRKRMIELVETLRAA